MTMIICLRCAHAQEDEKTVASCASCGMSVFVRTAHHARIESAVRAASPAQKEELLSALDDAVGEDADRECMYVVDADNITSAEGVHAATVHVYDGNESRAVLLDEETSLSFLVQ